MPPHDPRGRSGTHAGSHPYVFPHHVHRVEQPPVRQPISQYFGESTFGLSKMRERLAPEAYQDLVRSLEQGRKISRETGEAIAQCVKEWAVSKGVTHFCHWFQPMTGLTAEKHDAFITIQHAYHSELTVIERFSGSQLIQGEPDASSFPSGGMRTTFEARGYTAWDPTSPLFITEEAGTRTLCVPSVFFGYHGQALDNKTPLLRSNQTLSKELCRLLKLLGDVDVKSVTATLGAEQEYFLIDREIGSRRPDLVAIGRTVLGAVSARGQKLEDHYFGSIPARVKAYMEDLERELYRLGVPIKTRHNEVAPSQFEMAPIFENVSVATDHNSLGMEIMRRVASRHGLMCLLHEKPFAGVNGSGKHCNWSVMNDKGENLLDPGRTPHQNLRFLAMIAVVVRAVDEHAAMLAASIASASNALRLGENEAPPTIISVFLGSMLESILDSVMRGEAAKATEAQIIDLGVSHIPDISKDYTDRNRTSPFAFTGNKFEFRAVGSSANVAVPMSILNAAVADSASKCADRLKELMDGGMARDQAVVALIRELMQTHGRVLFSGDNYSESWRQEAARLGLPIIDTCAKAFAVMRDPKETRFLSDTKVLSPDELASRYNVAIERYVTTVCIELQTLVEMCTDFVIPALEKQLKLCYPVLRELRLESAKTAYESRVARLERLLANILESLEALRQALGAAESAATSEEKMRILDEEAQPAAKRLRAAADAIETEIADEFWPLPKYRELLFHPSMK